MVSGRHHSEQVGDRLCSTTSILAHRRPTFFTSFYLLRVFLYYEHVLTAQKWALNWAIAYATPYLVDYGPGVYANLQSKIFFVWFGCCFICIAFVWFYIYETKGLTLEEVDELYNEV